MANGDKLRRASYRKCVYDAAAGANTADGDLQTLISAAVASVPQPWIKHISGMEYHLLAHGLSKGSCFAGALVNYVKGEEVPLVDVLANGTTWEDTAPPMDKTGVRRNMKKSTLVFAIRENHVAVAATRELRVDDLLLFLQWLIQDKAKLIPGWNMNLLNLPSRSAVDKLNQRGVKKVQLGGSAYYPEKAPLSKSERKGSRKRYKTVIKQNNRLVEIIKSVVQDNAILEEIPLQEDAGNLQVLLEISYRSKKGAQSQKLLRDLAQGFGDNTDCNPSIELSDGSKIKGDELTITENLFIQAPGGNISIDDAMTKTARWLQSLIESRKV